MLRLIFQIIGNMNTNINQISIEENTVKQLCNMLQAKFQKDDGYDVEGMADCEKSLKLVVTARQCTDSEFALTSAVPQRQLSSRAVTLSHAIDNASIILSIAALSLQIAIAVCGVEDSLSSKDSTIENELGSWMSVITMALVLLASSKNKVLDYCKK